MDIKKGSPREGNSEANEERRGKELNPSEKLYNINKCLSSPQAKVICKIKRSCGFIEHNCIRCGKIFIPTRPEYAWEDCCSYTCYIHRNDRKADKARPCTAYNRYTGEKYRSFANTSEAAYFMGIINPRAIRDCCNGKTKTSAGFTWMWDD